MDGDIVMHGLPLYEQLAAEVTRQIERETFRVGERVPSVRATSRQRSLSVSTVLQAYRVLEDRGLLEARPQSGYFVRSRPAAPLRDADAPNAADPAAVDIDDLVVMLQRDTANLALVQFGAAIPDPSLLPIAKLNRTMAAVLRDPKAPRSEIGLPEGSAELRAQVAQRAFVAGCSLSPDDVVVTSGCTEAISLTLRTICQPGDLVAVESPTYFGVLHVMESLGLQAVEIPTNHESGISLDALGRALDQHRISACLVMSSFQNPLGSTMPESNKRDLVAMLAERGIPLIEDDTYGDLFFGGQRPRLAKAYDRAGLVILCSSFSKTISPSYRVGWCAPGRFRSRIVRLKSATNLSTATLPQLAIARFVESGSYDQHLRAIRRDYASRVAAMSREIIRRFPPGTRVSSPTGGFVLWVELPAAVDALVLYREALRAGITIAPGHVFSTTPKFQNYIRLNAAYMTAENEGAVRRLAEIVGRLASHS